MITRLLIVFIVFGVVGCAAPGQVAMPQDTTLIILRHGDRDDENLNAKGIARAKELIAAGEKIRYVGATGALSFDANGDVQAPKMTWKLDGDKNVETGYLTTEEVAALIAKLDGMQ